MRRTIRRPGGRSVAPATGSTGGRRAATRGFLAGLCALAAVNAVGAVAAAPAPGSWNEFGLPAAAAAARGDTIVEPFFAFVLAQAEADVVGCWRSADLAAFAAARGTTSKLPVGHLASLERRHPAPGSEDRYPGARVAAEWVLTFDSRLDFPFPYSLLGYHPGSLRLAPALVLAELAPVDLTLSWRAKRGREQKSVRAVRVFACEKGHLVLDADAVVDRLLGDLLDDAWTLGVATARVDEGRLAVSVMLGRDGRAIYGEFDLARDRIEVHGRPPAAALAAAARRWLEPAAGRLPTPWVED